ncbi:hypothetical protein R1sor_013000 [Riccia sorocarpa]|uniref:Rad60/SUMO-like domain-containing protein n=1 Tax=Riccia sorocarpa TaxID=122646 RepID=A0ABD3H754_9MARC
MSSLKTSPKRKAAPEFKLEPLFDYSRVTPTTTLEDSDDEELQIIDKIEIKSRRRPISKPLQVIQSNIGRAVGTTVNKNVEDDDDWLTPPKRVTVPAVRPADPHIIQLRQRKEEMLKMSILLTVEAAQAEATAKREAEERRAKLEAEQRPVISKVVENSGGGVTSSPREKITLQLQEQGGKIHIVKIYIDDTFEKLLAIFSEKIAKRSSTEFNLRFDGKTIDLQKTPKELELEDEDMIEIHSKSTQARKK